MIVVLDIGGAPLRLALPAAPIPGDLIRRGAETWRVTGRVFVAEPDREAELVVRVERAEAE